MKGTETNKMKLERKFMFEFKVKRLFLFIEIRNSLLLLNSLRTNNNNNQKDEILHLNE